MLCVWLQHDVSGDSNSIVGGVVSYFMFYGLCGIVG